MNDFKEKIFKTIAYYNKQLWIKSRSLQCKVSDVELTQPVFVVGCSRAGTTLVYKTLSESKTLGTLQKETHDFWAELYPPKDRNWNSHEIPENKANEQDKKKVSHFFYKHTGKKRIVDKNNQNGLSIPYLFKLFPDAHFVYIKRNPGDNINSLIHGWGKAKEFATWSDDLPEKINIDNGVYQRWCFFLAEGWRNYINSTIEDVCAFQYKAMNEAILQAKKNIPEKQWHEIQYEVLINSPVSEFKRIFQGCNLPFDSSVKQHCKEILNKPYNTFSEIKIDKWKQSQHSEKIETILPLVKDIAQKMGY